MIKVWEFRAFVYARRARCSPLPQLQPSQFRYFTYSVSCFHHLNEHCLWRFCFTLFFSILQMTFISARVNNSRGPDRLLRLHSVISHNYGVRDTVDGNDEPKSRVNQVKPKLFLTSIFLFNIGQLYFPQKKKNTKIWWFTVDLMTPCWSSTGC